MKETGNLEHFKQMLKSHVFKIAYNSFILHYNHYQGSYLGQWVEQDHFHVNDVL